MAEVGLTGASSWLTAAALYGGGGLLVSVIHLLDPTLVPQSLFFIAGVSILVSIVMAIGAERFGNSEPAVHARLLIGVSSYTVGAWLAPEAAPVFAFLPLMTLPTPCYLYGRRFIIPYVGTALTVELVVMLSIEGPARITHALIATYAMAVVAMSMILAKRRVRTLACRNRRLAFTDPLTGVGNTRAFRERLEARLLSELEDPDFALYAIDLDNFKQVNDRFDHSRGDEVLRSVARSVSDAVDPGDFVARRGGDEFTVIAYRADGRDLEELRDRIAAAIRAARMRTCPQVTPSSGVAYVRACRGEALERVIERADDALQETKHRERGLRARSADAGIPADANGASTAVVSPIDQSNTPAAASREQSDKGARKLRQRFLALFERDLDAAWISAAAMFGPVALLMLVVTSAGSLDALPTTIGACVAVSIAAITAGCVIAGLHRISHRWLHAATITVYALLAATVKFAGRDGVAFLELFPMLVLLGFIMFRVRLALAYLLLGQSLFAYFVVAGDAPTGPTGAAVGSAIVLMVGGLMSKLRGVTVRHAQVNRELSERDALTGLGNMRALEQRVRNINGRVSAGKLHPALIAIDLDEFKPVNDKRGHSTGDRMLRAVARELADTAGEEDLVARRGGDEFVIVVNDIRAEPLRQTARRLGDAVVRARSRVCPDLRPTASVATVEWMPGHSSADLILKADRALHEAKAGSRQGKPMRISA
ncbi:MAG: GGDEF domain-containing protein [Actinobacteria bacterium]|nr:GGDEF domain-containing protein [Actinomycetota bacterium]